MTSLPQFNKVNRDSDRKLEINVFFEMSTSIKLFKLFNYYTNLISFCRIWNFKMSLK